MIISNYQYQRWQNSHLHRTAGINIYKEVTEQGCFSLATWETSPFGAMRKSCDLSLLKELSWSPFEPSELWQSVWHEEPTLPPSSPLPYQHRLCRTLLSNPCWHFCPGGNPPEKPRGHRQRRWDTRGSLLAGQEKICRQSFTSFVPSFVWVTHS